MWYGCPAKTPSDRKKRFYQQLADELASRQTRVHVTRVDVGTCGEAVQDIGGVACGQQAAASAHTQLLPAPAAQAWGALVSPQVDKATFTWLRSHVIRHVATCASEMQVCRLR